MYNISKNVHFLGIRKDVNKIYQAMDVFLMPSLFEGLPISGVEAQASGLRCILADTISKQTALSENVEFISLNQSVDNWATRVVSCNGSYERIACKELIIKNGFDIKSQSEKLQEFYLKALKG